MSEWTDAPGALLTPATIYLHQRAQHRSMTDLPLPSPLPSPSSPTYPAVQYTRRPTKVPAPNTLRRDHRTTAASSSRTPWWRKLLALPASLHAPRHTNDLYDSRRAAHLEALVLNTLTARGAAQSHVFGLADAIATALLHATLDVGAAEALWRALFHGDARRAQPTCKWCVDMRRRVPRWIVDAVDDIDAQRTEAHAAVTLQLGCAHAAEHDAESEAKPTPRVRRAASAAAERPRSVRVPVPPLIPPPRTYDKVRLGACLDSPASASDAAHSDTDATAVEWMSEDEGVLCSATTARFERSGLEATKVA